MSAGHWNVYGQTGAGKSSYLRYVMIPKALKSEMPVILYDPFADPWPKGVYSTSNLDEFFKKAWAVNGALIAYDEAGADGRWNKGLDKLFMQARHQGNICVALSQRPQDLSRTVRGQADKFCIFALPPLDAEFLAREIGEPRIMTAADLPELSFIVSDRWKHVTKSRIKFPEEKP